MSHISSYIRVSYGVSLHSVPPDQYVLKRGRKRMSAVELSGDVGGRYRDNEVTWWAKSVSVS
jgi:hypothetical protein